MNVIYFWWVITGVLIAICLVLVLVNLKSQLRNPYTRDDFPIEFTKTRKIQMLFSLISLISLIVGIYSPAFRYGGNLGNNSLYVDGKSVFEVFEKLDGGAGIYVFPLIVSLVFCIIGIRASNRAFYFPLVISIFITIAMIVALNDQISSLGGGAASAGTYGGLGFYALIVSAISGGCVFLALLFSDKKRPTEQSATVTR